MDKKNLEELRQAIEQPCSETSRGFGLANVNERIHMHFGASYGMAIQSEEGKGTMVELTIPAIKEREELESGCSAR